MSRTIVLNDMKHSNVIVKDTSIIISRNVNQLGGDSTGVAYIMGGVSIELGRTVRQFIEALESTRLPLVVKRIVKKGEYSSYQVTRINTGKVPNVNLGYIETYKDTMVGFIYDTDIIINKRLRKYIKTSALNALAIRKEGNYLLKIERVLRLILKTDGEIKSKHIGKGKVIDLYVYSKVYKHPIKYRCVLEDDKYIFKSITLDANAYNKTVGA